jgi:hypothetical protein
MPKKIEGSLKNANNVVKSSQQFIRTVHPAIARKGIHACRIIGQHVATDMGNAAIEIAAFKRLCDSFFSPQFECSHAGTSATKLSVHAPLTFSCY